jgi:hypothetical protein
VTDFANLKMFYIQGVEFDAERNLTVTIESDGVAKGAITFQSIRNFLFFKETDYYPEIAAYSRAVAIAGPPRDGGVYRILSGAILDRVAQGRFDHEEPKCFWVFTPDECLEVLCFDDPVAVRF